ncbi:MAG: hypothetical protein KA436_06495 [Oligoflexales bacterium]|nr:hypothetical protein [Oligoflexales bacterium]
MLEARFRRIHLSLLVLSGFFLSDFGSAFEETKVLPKGVRSITFRSVSTDLSEKSNSSGELIPLASALEKDVTFKSVVNREIGSKKMLLQSFLHDKFAMEDSLGKFSADMRGSVSVFAPIFSYGITDEISAGFSLPYYRAKMAVRLGFKPSPSAEKFVSLLQHQDSHQNAEARTVVYKLNHAVEGLNAKLSQNGFAEIEDWEGQGLGDITLAAKYRFLNRSAVSVANATGFVLPTGRTLDANTLIGVPFGEGVYSMFSSFVMDSQLGAGFIFTDYLKYSYLQPGRRELRLKTEEESIEVAKENVSFKLGDRVDAGAALKYEPWFGLTAALGLNHSKKFSDRYAMNQYPESKKAWEKDTGQWSQRLEARLGYTSVPAFQRKEIAIPFSSSLEYSKTIKSKNSVVKDLMTFDVVVYF